MLQYIHDRFKDSQKTKGERQGFRLSQSQIFAQGDEETPLGDSAPTFPELGEAQEIHDQAMEDHGQPQAHLINPGGLEGALGRAANYWHYGQGSPEEKMADAAGALAHGIGAAQSFEDGNKRTAYHTTRYFLHNSGYGHLSPVEHDDEELADHLVGHGEGSHSLEDTQALFRSRLEGLQRQSNILDEIHDTLDPRVWEDEASPTPKLRKEHSEFLYEYILTALDRNGYDGMEKWLSLVFTGSLTTYQYSNESDVDISLFVDVSHFPEWSRAEMIGVMISECDGTKLPGTPFPLQCFVVPPEITKEDLYKPGLRSGYDLTTDTWIVPPDKSRVHDVEVEMNQSYTIALENADKMDRLLRYEPDKAIQFWHQIHKRRQRDHRKGRGDYSPSNITYKMLANRGLFPKISEVSGEYIAKRSQYESQLAQIAQAYHAAPMYDPQAHSAWEELAADSARRAEQIRNQYNYSVTDDPEPYPDAQAMFDDLKRGRFVVSRANSEHPIWTPEQNVNFRTVHDVLGHGPSGGDFSWEGENQACAAHSPLLSPAAQRALFTECIAQTAYANHFGGFGPQKTAFLDDQSGLRASSDAGTLCHRHIRRHGRSH